MCLLHIPHPEIQLAVFDLFNLYLARVELLGAIDKKETNLETLPKSQVAHVCAEKKYEEEDWSELINECGFLKLHQEKNNSVCVLVCKKQFTSSQPSMCGVCVWLVVFRLGWWYRLPLSSVWADFVCVQCEHVFMCLCCSPHGCHVSCE